MDGNMSDTYFSFGNKNFSRQELVDFLVKVYTCLHDNADYLTHIKSFDFVDYNVDNVVQIRFDLNNVTQFDNLNSHPNEFFIWLMRLPWTQQEINILEVQLGLKNQTLGVRGQRILASFQVNQQNGNAQPNPHMMQMVFMFHAARMQIDEQVCTVLNKVLIGSILRATQILLQEFDIPRVLVNIQGTLDGVNNVHQVASDCMVAAATAHVLYREALKKEAFAAGLQDYGKGAPQTLTRTECMKNSALITVCSLDNFKEDVVNFEQEIIAQARNGVGRHLQNPALNAVNGSQFTRFGKDYWIQWRDAFVTQMHVGHATVQRTHNVVMQTSQSGGGNISQFPNYHVSCCSPLSDADRVRSASSQNQSLWIVQQLAGTTPLSAEVCKKMMGIQKNINGAVVQQCAQFMATSHTLNDRPTVRGDYELKQPNRTSYSGKPEHIQCKAILGANDKYKSNVMLAVMAHFNPSPYVQELTASLAFVPLHVQKVLMLAFADAIEQNVTYTPQLEEALRDLFTETEHHVPFCPLAASKDFAMMSRVSTNFAEMNARLVQEVKWDHVPIYYGEGTRTPTETLADRDNRLLQDLVWDPYDHHVSEFLRPANCTLMEGSSAAFQEMHPMRSFSPKSISRGSQSTAAPAPVAAPIHDNLKQAAASASAFCRDPANWPVFYKHVLLVWLGHFFRASTRFVDNGAGMLAYRTSDPAHASDGVAVRYMSNGMHFMHGPRLPTLGEDPSVKSVAGEQCDIVLLRPNIEHEMLGIIMGRGGTQELGATFWGQTELSCYDDSQHGIWAMSYKYHEHAMVTNERNMIRAYDVAFDGYNGGFDQTCVD